MVVCIVFKQCHKSDCYLVTMKKKNQIILDAIELSGYNFHGGGTLSLDKFNH